MPFATLRRTVSRHPLPIVVAWGVLALVVGLAAPDLTKLAAEGQANLLPKNAESAAAAQILRTAWPDQAYESLAVAALTRPDGLNAADHAFAETLARRFARPDHPDNVLRVLGPHSPPEIAERLVSEDKTTQLVLVELQRSFVSPATKLTVEWLERQAGDEARPAGLELVWTGDGVFGRDYMADVKRSLDRAAIATVFLLMGVLLVVYRSALLAMVPLLTIGVSLVIARGVLAWLSPSLDRVGLDLSPLVELFLVVILFGCGTDFCLFLSWRFGEHWDPADPGGAMSLTLRRAIGALLTSAGTVVVGLSMMGLMQFKLFASTGPCVALGLILTVAAALTLTPALLVLLAKHHPSSFKGLTRPSSGFWDVVGHKILARPILTWALGLLLMVPAAALGSRTTFIQDVFAELPQSRSSVKGMGLIAKKFGPGMVGPLTVVLRADRADLRDSQGLALIDEISRYLSHQRSLKEVRSATQPLGSTEPLDRARLASRLGEVNAGFGKMADGADQLRQGLTDGAAKLSAARLLEELTGISVTGGKPTPKPAPAPAPAADAPPPKPKGDPLSSGLKQVYGGLFGTGRSAPPPAATATQPATPSRGDPRDTMLKELQRAAEGAGEIADGARRAHHEVSSILADPVGRRALDRLLITPDTVRENPALLKSFAAYISPDGRLAQIDLVPTGRVFSPAALDQVETLRHRLRDYVGEMGPPQVHAILTGPNAESADIRDLTRRDQIKTWILVPLAVFLVLVLALRDVVACLNLVGTMVLTYLFALGVTHLVFVTLLGNEGLDWKVPYFLFVMLVAIGVDYNVFLMARLQEESKALGLRAGITRGVAQTGGLISSAAAITVCSFSSLLFSPLVSLRQLGFALVVGITIDAVLVRPVLVPCGQWLLHRPKERNQPKPPATPNATPPPTTILPPSPLASSLAN